MEKLMLTPEEMIESLYLKAEEIQLKTMVLARRVIAHGFASFSGHIVTLDARVLPLDTIYEQGRGQERLAEITARLEFYGWMNATDMAQEYQKQASNLDAYIAYLDYVIESGKAIPMAAMEGAA